MSKYSAGPAVFPGDESSLATAPAWTVPSDAVPNSDKNLLTPNDQMAPPTYAEYPMPSAPDISELPPNYYDISIVPNNAVLHYNEVSPYAQPSQAETQRKSDGVLSFDPLIEKNPDQLWLYFMTYQNVSEMWNYAFIYFF